MKRIAIALSVLTVLVLAAPAGAELCEKCKGKMFIMSVGKCVECGGFTGSGAHKLCRKCSAKLGQCEHCRAKLHAGDKPPMQKPKDKPILIKPKPGPTPIQPIRIDLDKILQPGTHVSGKWKYDYAVFISHPHKRGGTEYIGSLFYDGKPIAGAKMWDRIKTPWGLMQYLGRKKGQLNQGWMSARNSKGRMLPSPEKSAPKPAKIDTKKDGTYTSGKWKYEYTVRAGGKPRKPREWRTGLLTYDGKPIAGAKMWDRIKTPWGTMQYYQPYHRKSYFQNSYLRRWMLEMPGGGPINPTKGWLLPSPALRYLRPLELDASVGGKTVSAFVGQRIVIRLKTDGHRIWRLGKVESDAIKQVGGAEYIRGPGVEVGHLGPGKFAFTFGAVKPGTAKLTLEYRRPGVVPSGPERSEGTVRGPANKTFTLTVTVKPDPTAVRVRKLKANLDKFAMTICYRGQGPRGGRPPRWCRHITLSVPPALVPRTPSWQVRRISTEQAEKIIDRLAKTGFLARAATRAAFVRKMGDRYALAVYMRKPGPRSPMLMDIIENIGWGPQLLKRLEGLGLKEVLDGDAAKAVDFLLEPLAERFRKEKESPAPAKIDTKKSGKYTSGKWKYQYTIRAVGTRSERRFSGLIYDGNLIAGAKMWDRIKTPWGMMQYYQMSYVRGWMLELTGGTPINPKKGRLLPSPEKTTSSGLAALELDKSHNGKTVSAVVGQEIVIRLKGNATTGYSWVIGKIEGDALGQVGKVKYVSDQPPAPAGGRGRGLMMHRVGGGGKYVFTFTAKKAGTAKLSLEYKRGWEKNKPPAKTFTLTVSVKLAAKS
jgi:predicted secreted protein